MPRVENKQQQEWAGGQKYPYTRDATFVLAASDASEASRNQADWRCAGTADDVDLQAAIDALPSGGGKVVLSEGTFTLTAQVDRAINNVTIKGAGRSTLLNLNGSTAVITAGSQTGWVLEDFATDAGGITGADDTIVAYWKDGVRTVAPSDARGATLTVAASDAIDPLAYDYQYDGTADEVQINLAIAAVAASGAGAGKVMLSEGTFTLAASVDMDDGVTLEGQGYGTQLYTTADIQLVAADTVDNIVVRDMRLTSDGTGTNLQNGVRFESVNNGRVEGLYVEVMAYDGIQFLTGCQRCVATNNWVDDCGDDGINVGGGTSPATGDIIVTNNHVWACTATGIHCSWGSADMTISNNVIGTCSQNGIDLLLESAGAKRATLVGNVITDVGAHGICVSSDAGDDITDVIIMGNMLEGIANNGVRVDVDSDRFLIAFNILKSCVYWGIVVTQDSDADQQICILGNIVDGGIASGNAGIYVSKSSLAQIINNSVCNIHVDANAIVEANCSGALIMGNRVEEPIAVGGTDTVVKDNIGSVIDGLIADPGDGNAIPVTRSGHVPLVTGGAETRTLADAAAPGLTIDLYFKTDLGDCVITAASDIDQAGNNVMTFADVGDHIRLTSIEDGADYEWRIVANDGVALA